jgi:transposase InsO family protein
VADGEARDLYAEFKLEAAKLVRERGVSVARAVRDLGITCRISGSGNVWDNAAVESCLLSLKTERTARKGYRTRVRGHSTLGYLSPEQYEEQCGLA